MARGEVQAGDSGWLMRKAGPLVAARMGSFFVTLGIPLVLARALSLEQYGTYKQIFMIGMLLSQALPMGIAQSLYYFLPRSLSSRPLLGQTILVLAGIGVLGGLAVYAIIDPLAAYMKNPDLARHGWALATYSAVLVASAPLDVTPTSWGRTKTSGLIIITSDMTRAAALIVPVLLGHGLEGAMKAIVAWSVLRLLATLSLLFFTPPGPLFDGKLLRQQIAWALPFGGAMLMAIPPRYTHEFLVSSAVGPALYAIYAAGCFQVPLVNLLYTPTSEVLMVRIAELESRGRMEEAASAFAEATARLSYVFLPMYTFLFAAAPEFIEAVFGPKFMGAVPIFRVSSFLVVLAILPIDGALRACNETRYLFVSYLVKAVVAVPLVWALVHSFGMMGGAWALVLTEGVGKSVLMLRIPRALKATFSEVVPWRALTRAGGAATASGLFVVLARAVVGPTATALPEGFFPRLVPLLLAAAFFGTGYVGALLGLGIRPTAALRALRG